MGDDTSQTRLQGRFIGTQNPMVQIYVPRSPLHDLARFAQSSGWADIPLKAAVTTGEPLYAHQRRSISQAIQDRAEQLFGPGMRVHFEVAGEIPGEESGKYLFTRGSILLPARMGEEKVRMPGSR